MNDGGSIGDFFYNIVPGSIFLFLLNYLYNFNIVKIVGLDTEDSANIIFVYIIFGLFFGFLFQCFSKMARHWFWNNIAFKKVKSKNEEEFNKVCIYFFGKNYKNDKKIYEDKSFYLIDNFLRGKEAAFLPTHFSSRHAFWSNIAWSIFFLILTRVYFNINIALVPSLIVFIFLIFSIWMADEHLFNFYDSILKSYYMYKFDKGDFPLAVVGKKA